MAIANCCEGKLWVKNSLIILLLALISWSPGYAQVLGLDVDTKVVIEKDSLQLTINFTNVSNANINDIVATPFVAGRPSPFPPIATIPAGETGSHTLELPHPWAARGNYYIPVHILHRLTDGRHHAFYTIAEVSHQAIDTSTLISSVPQLTQTNRQTFEFVTRISNPSSTTKHVQLTILPTRIRTSAIQALLDLPAGEAEEHATELRLGREDNEQLREILVIADYEENGYHYARLVRSYYYANLDPDWLVSLFSNDTAVNSLLFVIFTAMVFIWMLDRRRQRKIS